MAEMNLGQVVLRCRKKTYILRYAKQNYKVNDNKHSMKVQYALGKIPKIES